MTFEQVGLLVPTILLPGTEIDLQRWAVVACDQYTSQPDYWEAVKSFVGDQPSALNLVLPEVYLESDQEQAVVETISVSMKRYLDESILMPGQPGFVLVDRETSHTPSRKGLIVALDLEQYDYRPGAQSLIRATEGTIVDRLPPRVRVRKQASIETPHIMVLIDDPDSTVIEPLFERELQKIYDVELMMDSGRVQGFKVDDQAALQSVANSLAGLADPGTFSRKYGVSDTPVLLYAMGDGNHSLATAKVIWEEFKREASDKQAIMQHPARYALVELVNVHDPGLVFEPIHRLVFNARLEDMKPHMESFYRGQGSSVSLQACADLEEARSKAQQLQAARCHCISYVTAQGYGLMSVADPSHTLEVATLQAFLDHYLKERPKAGIDYIHGDDVVSDLGTKPDNIGFFLEPISKHDLFKTIIFDGALPRKTFSMGEADEKRFYLECRKIVP